MTNYVYRIVGDRLVKTPVMVGLSNNERFEITSGLKRGRPGGSWVRLPKQDLSDGLRVKVHR